MTTRTTRAAVASGAALLALGLTACGGGNASTPEPEAGPLDKYFEEMYGEWDEDQANAQMVQVEELVAECMREQGFEYTPVDQSQGGEVFEEPELDVEWGTLEFAEEYGYGITTDPWGSTGEPMPDEGEMWVDPNEDYVSAMSETERMAYEAALYGEPTEFEEPIDGEEMEYEYDWEDAGCQGSASHEVYETVPGVDEDEFTALQDEMNTMYEASMSDPRVTGLDAEWASCMADAGHSGLAAPGDAETLLHDEVNALWETAYDDVDMSADLSEDDYLAIEASIQQAQSAITPREIEMAVADFTCREDVRYDEVQREVSFEYQQEFVDTHKAELDAWLAATASE